MSIFSLQRFVEYFLEHNFTSSLLVLMHVLLYASLQPFKIQYSNLSKFSGLHSRQLGEDVAFIQAGILTELTVAEKLIYEAVLWYFRHKDIDVSLLTH